MTLITYVDTNFRAGTLAVIEQANEILEEYADEGYIITLRQLYYQFVSKGYIPNNQQSYDRLGDIVGKGRMAGMISWTGIEDRGRECHEPYNNDSMQDIMTGLSYHYKVDPWENQDNYVEVWVEKEALGNVIERPAERWGVSHMACKGYMSLSELWAASNRLNDKQNYGGKQCHIIHLGDHDPSGIDMTRDIGARLNTFECDVIVHRIALTYDQVLEHSPEPNPAKETDSRFAAYRDQYGDESWELDALRPQILDSLIDKKIQSLLDPSEFDKARRKTKAGRLLLDGVGEYSEEVLDFIRDLQGDVDIDD